MKKHSKFELKKLCLKIKKTLLILFFLLSTSQYKIYADCGQTSPDLVITNSGTLSSGFYNRNIIISGGITVTISNATILLGEGMKIYVGQEALLILDHSTLTTSCQKMWFGVELAEGNPLAAIGGGKIKSKFSTISNAEYGIDAHYGFDMDIEYSTFDRNCVGINIVDGPSIADNANGNFYCIGTTFTTSFSPLLSAFTGQNLPTYSHGWFGILGGWTYLNIGDQQPYQKNVFKNLNSGIQISPGQINIFNADFLDIKNYDNQIISSGKEYAIYNSGLHGQVNSYVGVSQNGARIPVNILSCTKGVFMQYVGGEIYGNTMNDVDYGIDLRNGSTGSTMTISQNYIQSKKFGIVVNYLYGLNAASLVSIDDNTILFNNPSTSQILGWGIYAHDFNISGTTLLRIARNHIFANAAGDMGISVQNINSSEIVDNDIHINHNRINGYGLGVVGCVGTKVKCNSVFSNAIVPSPTQVSYYSSLSTNAVVSCNYSNNTYFGFRFYGFCGGTGFNTNTIGNHAVGLSLSNTAVIGPQINKGNTWVGNYLSYGATHDGGINVALSSLIKVNPFQSPYLPTFPLSLNGWFQQSVGNAPVCALNCNWNYPNLNYSDLELKIAQDQVMVDPNFEESSKWISQKYLFEKLKSDSLLRDSLSDFTDFYVEKENSAIDKLVNIDDKIKISVPSQEALNDLIDIKKSLIETNFSYINSIDSIIYDSLTNENIKVSLKAQKILLLNNINQLEREISGYFQIINNEKNVFIDELRDENGEIVTNKVIEENEKKINDIYLSTIAKGVFDFSTDQLANIYDIGHQCPFLGGNAVYKARGMYFLVNDEENYNDDEICLQSGIVARNSHQNNNSSIKLNSSVYPNPASSEITISYNLATSGKLIIYNTYGQIVYSIDLNEKNYRHSISVSEFSNGIYLYKILSDNHEVDNGRFSILK